MASKEDKARVMIVEDAPTFQELLVLTLSLEPFIDVTYIAESGEDAMENFVRASPDLVLMDFRLPGMNGLETAKRMKKQRPDVKIAIVTGFSEEVLQRMASEASVEDVIPKTEFGLPRVLRLLDRNQSAVGPTNGNGLR